MTTIPDKPSARRLHLAVVGAFLAVALLTLGPLDPFSEVWGGATDDFFEHVQLVWWQAHQAAQGRPFPLFTTDLAFPDGGKMFLPDPIGGTAAIPFVWVMGTAFAYNLLMLANFVFAGWAVGAPVRAAPRLARRRVALARTLSHVVRRTERRRRGRQHFPAR